MKVSLKSGVAIAVSAVMLGGAGVVARAVPADAAAYDCWPRGAAVAKTNSRVVGNGSASCGSAGIPESMRITVKHYYAYLPDATAFTGLVRKPSSAVNWTGSVRRCDNSTKAQYYVVVQMLNWAERGTKTSKRMEIKTCAGNGA